MVRTRKKKMETWILDSCYWHCSYYKGAWVTPKTYGRFVRKTIVKFEMHDSWKYNSSLFCWYLHKSVARYRLPKSILLIHSISSWDISRPLNLKLSYMACHVSFPYIFCTTVTVFHPNSATPSPEMVYFLCRFWTTMQLFVIDWHH